MRLRTLLIDDMPLSRSRVRRHLEGERDVEILGECGDVESALEHIRRLQPNLLLLDVQMPDLTGFALLERIPSEDRPAVVFITAFEEFALQAFSAQAVDYLLKPFEQSRLSQALERVRIHLRLRSRADTPTSAPDSAAYLARIPIRGTGRTVFVSTDSIQWIETAGNYLVLHCGEETHLLRETMSRIERQLDPAKFVRIHRSTITRVDAIESIQPLPNGERAVMLQGGVRVTLSRSYRERVRPVLGAL